MGCNRMFLAALTLLLFSAHAYCQTIGSGTIVIGLAPVEVRIDRQPHQESGPSDYLAKATVELLPNYIQRGLERGLDRRVTIVPPGTNPAAGLGQIPSAELLPIVESMATLGIRITVRILNRPELKTSPETQNLGEEVLLLSPSANFGDLDEKLTELGIRLAKRITDPSAATASSRLPRGVVGFYCVTTVDSADPQLTRLARALTIELPYQLSQSARKRNLEFVVRGLDLKEAISTCDPSAGFVRLANTAESRIENFTWTGTLSRDPKNKNRVSLTLRFRDTSGGGNFRPLTPVLIEDIVEPGIPNIAEKLVADFAQSYAKSQNRIFFHFESEAVRKALEQKLTTVLSDNGYTVVGSDPPDATIAASWIDYFFQEDCQTAIEVRRLLLPALSPGLATAPFIRKQSAGNRPGTIGIWLSSKQIASLPATQCQ